MIERPPVKENSTPTLIGPGAATAVRMKKYGEASAAADPASIVRLLIAMSYSRSVCVVRGLSCHASPSGFLSSNVRASVETCGVWPDQPLSVISAIVITGVQYDDARPPHEQ
jgi:hypothetical protein